MPRRSPELDALGAAIREERTRLGFTQQEVADRAGVKREYLAGVERGERNSAYETLLKIARSLEAPLSRLVQAAERRLS